MKSRKKKPSAERGVKTLLKVIAELVDAAVQGPFRPDCSCATCTKGLAAIKRGKETLELMR